MSEPIFFQVVVMDNRDPMMLGRIRAKLLIDNYNDIVQSITDPPWDEKKDVWTSRDPFIFNPLMPYFMYQVPKVEELAQVIYVNSDFKYQNQYYIQNTFSSPTTITFEYYQGGNKFTGTGTQLANPKPNVKNQHYSSTNKEECYNQIYGTLRDLYFIFKSKYFIPSYNSGLSRFIIIQIAKKNNIFNLESKTFYL